MRAGQTCQVASLTVQRPQQVLSRRALAAGKPTFTSREFAHDKRHGCELQGLADWLAQGGPIHRGRFTV